MKNRLEDIKKRIKEILEDNDISVNSVSEKVDIPQKTLNNQINGKSSSVQKQF